MQFEGAVLQDTHPVEGRMPAEIRYRALLVGNGDYSSVSGLHNLNGPANDVAIMADALSDEDYGLHAPAEVSVLLDHEQAAVTRAIEEFFVNASPQDQLLFYFSGHGLVDVDGNLYFAVADTSDRLLRSSAVARGFLNDVASRTAAVATAIVLDCCYSGTMKSASDHDSLIYDARGKWTLASSRRDQLSTDGPTPSDPSAFTKLVAEALVGGSSVDRDEDGFVTMSDLLAYVSPRLARTTGQNVHHAFEGSGELAVALAPGYPAEEDYTRDWVVVRSGSKVPLPQRPVLSDEPGADMVAGPERATSTPESSALLDPAATVEEFVAELMHALEEGRKMRVRQTLQSLSIRAAGALEADNGWPSLADAMDKMTGAAAVFLNYDFEEWFNETLAKMVRSYENGFDSSGNHKTGLLAGTVSPADLWYAWLQRIFGLGSLAVRLQNWRAVVKISLQRPEGYDFKYYGNWMRHALTMASRANLFKREQNGQFVAISPLFPGIEFTASHSWLTPDGVQEATDVQKSACQFDALYCVAALARAPEFDTQFYYPSFADYGASPVESILTRLVSDPQMRAAIAPVEDSKLAEIVDYLDDSAGRTNRTIGGWWGLRDETLATWVRDHKPL